MKDIYTIENNYLSVKVTNLGATLMSLYDKEKKLELTLGFDTVDEYIKNNTTYFGATVGRCANRIGDSHFMLNDKEYHVLANDGKNSLHGGSVQYSFEEFELVSKDDTSLTFKYFSKDGEAGYPGNLNLEIAYRLKDKELDYEIKGVCDEDSLFNITNHSYFNLDNELQSALETEILIPADKVCVNDSNGMASDKVKDVENTVYDFRKFKKLKDIINKDDNLAKGGLDHNYVFENMDDKLVCAIRNEKVCLSVYSDLPDVQIYTADGIETLKGRSGITYKQYWGIAIEPQYAPNAINYENFIKPIIKANKEVKHHIRYVVD